MSGPVSGVVRWSRAAVLTAVALTTGVVAHAAAGGLLPGPAGLALPSLVCLLVAGALLGRPASTRRVVLLVVAGQTFIHLALTATAGHRGNRGVGHGGESAAATRPAPTPYTPPDLDRRGEGSLYDQFYGQRPAVPAGDLTVPAPIQHLLDDLTGPNALMALAHVAASVVVGLWLAAGERALWTVFVLSAAGLYRLALLPVGALRLLASLTPLPSSPDRRSDRERTGAPPARRRVMLARTVVRRGPPRLLDA